MSRTTVQISELRLRVHGLTREQARRLGEDVAERLAQSPLAWQGDRKTSALNVRVIQDTTKSIERMADEIADGIRRNLR